MCGVAGAVNLTGGAVPPELVERMGAVLEHRGPDDAGLYAEDNVGFCHRRLSIIDLTSGHQPMTFDDHTIVYNGELYNYLELRAELQAKGHGFRTSSDTEVILRAYQEYGADCVTRFNGMFAFLLHDRRRHLLFTARDHFGIKPLYFCRTATHLLFASEVKALLQHPEVTAARDFDALREYLTFQFVLGDRTLFQGIRKLPPGHYQVVDLADGAIRTVRYWEPSFRVDPYHTEEYFVTELRRLLTDAVALQMRSDVPVGTYLSGGLDSSIISILAAGHVPGGLKCFNGSFREGPEFDESAYAREVAAACRAELLEIVPGEDEFVELMPRLVYHMDEPGAGPGLFPQYVVARSAARHVKVCLGGQGGDEIFGGYARYLVAYLEQALKGAIFETNEEAEHIVSLKSIVPHLPSLRQYSPMLKEFWGEGVFEPMDRRYFRLVDRSGGDPQLLSEDFRACFDRDDLFARFQTVFNHPDTRSYYNKMTHFDLVTGLPALLQVEDRMSMAVSLESRVPFLDPRIVTLVTSMPPRMKFKGGAMKYILKEAVGDILPPSILHRKEKMGFPVPLHLWARGRAHEFFADTLLSRRSRDRGLIDCTEVERLMQDEAPFSRRLWGLLNVELWHRQFLDAA
jgi:asparagine synthase (glutamine-hydrolysing)